MSIAREVHVGTPTAYLPPEYIVKVHFHNFKSLPQAKGVVVKSPNFNCADYEWTLCILPSGEKGSSGGVMGVFLCNESTSKIVVDYDIILKTRSGDNFHRVTVLDRVFPIQRRAALGMKDFVHREEILDESNNILNNGAILFEVRIRPRKEYYGHGTKRRFSLSENILQQLFLDKGTADVAFEVQSKIFYAHRIILKLQTPDLAVLFDQYDKTRPLCIEDVHPQTFHLMLKHSYGIKIQPNEWEDKSKEILDAAGKYGFSLLKSEAEAWYVQNIKFTAENAINELLYADGHDCPLLKEAAIKYVVRNGQRVIATDSFERLDESPRLRKEVMEASFAVISSSLNAHVWSC